jgi:gamma-glutamylcyclotransferase (GGCT)/AIG2-like uncharacterized protein YtfP
MNQSNLYAFYGSLRRGMENYEPLKENLRYQFSIWITGYQLYSLGPHPFAYSTGSPTDKILVEVFEVTNLVTEQTIHQIEMEAGYFLDTITIDGQSVKIYLYENKADYPFVFGGDWVQFFRG